MGFDLDRDGDRQRLSYREWATALGLGLRYGWQPTGTTFSEPAVRRRHGHDAMAADVEEAVARERELWYGGYLTNDDQVVSAADAAALADASERAVDDAAVPEAARSALPPLLELPMGDFIDFAFRPAESAFPSLAFVGDDGRGLPEGWISPYHRSVGWAFQNVVVRPPASDCDPGAAWRQSGAVTDGM